MIGIVGDYCLSFVKGINSRQQWYAQPTEGHDAQVVLLGVLRANVVSIIEMFCYGQVSKVGGKPSLVSLYYKIAARAFEPFGKETGELSYEASLAQVRHCNLSA